MLRIMKKKILDEEENSLKQAETSPETTLSCNPLMVSHVPVSVGSRSIPASTTSSISSKGDECVVNQVLDSTPIVTLQSKKRLLSQMSRKSPSESSNESSLSMAMPAYQSQEKSLNCQSNVTHTVGECSMEPISKKQRLDERTKTQGSSTPTLLAREEDAKWLSPLHIFVRSQIEVFTATSEELSQPAPGRKQPIKLNQVGLRCIHCRHLPGRQRVKRAVCYPSTVARVYHSVSDMKFDHFSNCKSLPPAHRAEFERLKASGGKASGEKKAKGSSASTSKYYQDAARRTGMTDGPGGVFLSAPQPTTESFSAFLASKPVLTPRPDKSAQQIAPPKRSLHEATEISMQKLLLLNALSKTSHQDAQPLSQTRPSNKQVRIRIQDDDDAKHLNPLHCFVRRHVEFFTADKIDIAAPAPGRKARVVLGQVGIRCVHCAKLPAKARVKRTVCYPPSIGAIYHSVSNMKFDHFALCKGLPPQAREEFQTLKASCSRRGTAGNNNGKRGSSSSTAQYYQDSATSKGLVDTQVGIFMRTSCDNKTTDNITNKARSLPAEASTTAMPAGLSALMQAISQAA